MNKRKRILLSSGILCVCLLCFLIQFKLNTPVDTGVGQYKFDELKSDLKAAQQEYELYVPGYAAGSYGEFSPLSEIDPPRYLLYRDNIYRAESIAKDNVATIMLTGDLMCQGRQQQAAQNGNTFDFSDNFSYIESLFKTADFVVGNLECSLSETASLMMEEPKVDNAIHCNAPSTFLDAVRFAGFDMLMTANNHCLDGGLEGLFRTYAHLDQYGFIHTGTFLSNNETRFKVVEIDGIKVAFISYSTKFNKKENNITEAGQDIFINVYDKDKLADDVLKAKEMGAEFIIAYNHWGTEYTNQHSDIQIKYAQEMADAGVDYIIGSHPHALQPYDILTSADGRSVPVLYSLGNFVSHQKKTVSKETVVIQLELTRDSNGKVIILQEGAIPCRTFKTFSGHNYTTIPITEPYRNNLSSKYFAEAYGHIKDVIGDKITLLGDI